MRRGNSVITMPIVLAFSVISLLVIAIMLINILTPYIMYEKLLSTTTRYMFVLEEYGYLTEKDIRNIYDDLVKQGFESDKIKIEATTEPQDYGKNVSLEIQYSYVAQIALLKNNSLNIENKEKETILRVKKYGVSKV